MPSLNLAVAIVLCLVALLAGAGIAGMVSYRKGIAAGVEQRKQQAEAAIGSAEKEAGRILEDAQREADAKKKNALVEAKDEIYKLRSEAEKEIKDRRSEVGRQERRVQQKEESLDKKTDNLERKEESLKRKIQTAEQRLAEAEEVKASQMQELERISELTREQAKEYILQSLEDELTHEKALRLSSYEQQLKDECGLCGNAAQRRDEGTHHRQRGTKHPCAGNADRCRYHHRRYAGGNRPVLFRPCAP